MVRVERGDDDLADIARRDRITRRRGRFQSARGAEGEAIMIRTMQLVAQLPTSARASVSAPILKKCQIQ